MSTDIINIPVERGAKGGLGAKGYPQAVRDMFMAHYATHGDVQKACDLAGISYYTARNWLSDPRFVATVHRHRQMALMAEAGGIAYRVLLEIATAKVVDKEGKEDWYAPPSERRQAALALMRFAGHSDAMAAAAATSQQVAALHELTEEQLAAHIAQAQDTLAALQQQPDSGVSPDVAPQCQANDLM